MSQKFYKNIKLILFCKVCGVKYLPERYSKRAEMGGCYKHRWVSQTQWNSVWYAKLPPERKKIYAQVKYGKWKNWVKNNIEGRRRIARISYHKRKLDSKNRARRHRATKKPS